MASTNFLWETCISQRVLSLLCAAASAPSDCHTQRMLAYIVYTTALDTVDVADRQWRHFGMCFLTAL